MKEAFVEQKLSPATMKVIDQANEIIEDFQQQGYRLTLRQLYYQFVTANFITNEEKSYKRLASIVSDGRLAGYIDWAAIEDRGRVASVPHYYNSPSEMLNVFKRAAQGYTVNHWAGQSLYVELWVEKQALAGVLEPLAEKYQATLMVNKGYSSSSAMYDAAKRIRERMGTVGDRSLAVRSGEDPWYMNESERDGLVLYLGDHDPSGEDMVRDIRERLTLFGVDAGRFEVRKVALTTAQVKQYKPLPNPAKISDPRAAAYVTKHGNSSWEVDALPPATLHRIIETEFKAVIDPSVWDEVIMNEQRTAEKLYKAVSNIRMNVSNIRMK